MDSDARCFQCSSTELPAIGAQFCSSKCYSEHVDEYTALGWKPLGGFWFNTCSECKKRLRDTLGKFLKEDVFGYSIYCSDTCKKKNLNKVKYMMDLRKEDPKMSLLQAAAAATIEQVENYA